MKKFCVSISFLLAFGWTTAQPCIDPGQIDLSTACITLYLPVCGCDGVTYGNSCEAENWGGVTSWTNGPCGVSGGNCQADFQYNFGIVPPEVFFTDQSTATSAAIVAWHWDFGDGTSSSDQNPIHVFPVSGLYVVCLTITTADGCAASFCDSLYVTGCVEPAQIDTTTMCPLVFDPVCGCNGVTYGNSCEAINYGGVTSWVPGLCNPICEAGFNVVNISGNTVDFDDASSSVMDPIASWTWDFGDGVASNIQNPSHTYGSTGNYIVCLTIVTNDGCTSTFCDTISLGNGNCIDTSLIDSTMICPLGLVPVCGCDSVTYDNACYATYYGGVTSWSQGACPWDVCASATNLQNISTTATTANLSWSDQGANMYKVKYKCVSCPSPVQTKTVTGGNYNTTLHNLTPCAIYRWKVIHRCDGVRYASPVSAPFLTAGCRLGEVPGADILDVYPNPASEKLNVTYYAWEDSEAKITVHDLIGRMVFEDAVELAEGNSLVELSLSDFENGIYLLTLSDGVETSIKKFMVSK